MLRTRIAQGLGALVIGGVAFAALSPLLPVQEPMQPSEQHGLVQAAVGNWEGSLFMAIPGMPEPMEMPCAESVKAVGKFWTVSEFSGNFGGQAFTGISQVGYDPTKKKFIGTWLDNQHPYMSMMEGDWDAEKNAIVMHYEQYDTMSGAWLKMRNEGVYTDNSYVLTFFQLADEGESEMMRIEMKRKPVEAAAGR